MTNVCLRCQKEFKAESKFNRLCKKCLATNKRARFGIRKASISTGKKIYD